MFFALVLFKILSLYVDNSFAIASNYKLYNSSDVSEAFRSNYSINGYFVSQHYHCLKTCNEQENCFAAIFNKQVSTPQINCNLYSYRPSYFSNDIIISINVDLYVKQGKVN